MLGVTKISKYLEKFTSLARPDELLKKTFLAHLQKTTRIVLTEKEIDIRSGVLYIKTDPTTKNELFYQKESIRSFLRENTKAKEIVFK